MLAIIGAQSDRLILQVVGRVDETDGPAFRAHQDGIGRRARALAFYAPQ